MIKADYLDQPMEMRDIFAIRVAQSLLLDTNFMAPLNSEEAPAAISARAYEIADALMSHRKDDLT